MTFGPPSHAELKEVLPLGIFEGDARMRQQLAAVRYTEILLSAFSIAGNKRTYERFIARKSAPFDKPGEEDDDDDEDDNTQSSLLAEIAAAHPPITDINGFFAHPKKIEALHALSHSDMLEVIAATEYLRGGWAGLANPLRLMSERLTELTHTIIALAVARGRPTLRFNPRLHVSWSLCYIQIDSDVPLRHGVVVFHTHSLLIGRQQVAVSDTTGAPFLSDDEEIEQRTNIITRCGFDTKKLPDDRLSDVSGELLTP